MSEPDWLELRNVVDSHAGQLALFGGADGIRDTGLLESALARPQNKYAYAKQTWRSWLPPMLSALPATTLSSTATNGQLSPR